MASRRKRIRYADTDRYYDRYKRDQDAKRFYNSAAWRLAREEALQRDHYTCQPCLRRGMLTPADTVHHLVPIETAPEKALDLDNLEPICQACHNKEHPERGAGERQGEERPRKARVIASEANPEIT